MPLFPPALASPSGGLVYHYRALRYARGLWMPFRAAVGDWLAQHVPAGRELVLVGPSAGHCLPLELLRGRPGVWALELDPLARRLLAHRLAPTRIDFETGDLLLAPLLSGAPALDDWLAQRPGAAVVFCNLLGQLHFALSDAEQARFVAEFQRRVLPALSGRPWATFHDRWSLDVSGTEPLVGPLSFACQPGDDELGEAWFGAEGAPVTVLDHGTTELFPAALPRRYFGWHVTPTALHIVEAVAAPHRP